MGQLAEWATREDVKGQFWNARGREASGKVVSRWASGYINDVESSQMSKVANCFGRALLCRTMEWGAGGGVTQSSRGSGKKKRAKPSRIGSSLDKNEPLMTSRTYFMGSLRNRLMELGPAIAPTAEGDLGKSQG